MFCARNGSVLAWFKCVDNSFKHFIKHLICIFKSAKFKQQKQYNKPQINLFLTEHVYPKFGAYTGFKKFIIKVQQAIIIIEERNQFEGECRKWEHIRETVGEINRF